MKTGTVKFFKEGKNDGKGGGYGFIIDDDSQKEYFVHVSGCREKIQSGDRVSFIVTQGKKGEVASDVSRV